MSKKGVHVTKRTVQRDLKAMKFFLGSSLNAVVVFNLEVTQSARFELKTTAAFNEEPKKKI